MNKNLALIFFVSVIIIAVATLLFYGWPCGQNQYLQHVSYADYVREEEMALAVEEFAQNVEMKVFLAPEDTVPVCVAVVLWQYIADLSKQERIVLAATECAQVLVQEDDLRSVGAFRDNPKLYKLEKINDQWVVIDYDERMFSYAPSTKQWVDDFLKLVPQEVEHYWDPIFVSAKLTNKAGKLFGLETPKYRFSFCKNDKHCFIGEVCLFHGIHSNFGRNKCVKRCVVHSECGRGYSCRGQCLRGENGCPDTAVDICIPDLVHYQLKKSGAPF